MSKFTYTLDTPGVDLIDCLDWQTESTGYEIVPFEQDFYPDSRLTMFAGPEQQLIPSLYNTPADLGTDGWLDALIGLADSFLDRFFGTHEEEPGLAKTSEAHGGGGIYLPGNPRRRTQEGDVHYHIHLHLRTAYCWLAEEEPTNIRPSDLGAPYPTWSLYEGD